MPILSGSDDRDEEAYITDDWQIFPLAKKTHQNLEAQQL